MEQKSNTAYKWRKIFAAKAYGGKEIKLTPIEAQELIDDIENEVKYALDAVMDSKGAKEHIEPPKSVIFKGWQIGMYNTYYI